MSRSSTDPLGPRADRLVLLKYWWLALRPKTLLIAIVPVLIGSALAWSGTGVLAYPVMAAALIAAILIQAGTNLHNDAADFERGTDDPATRLGPPRVTAQGWLSPAEVRYAAGLCFALAMLIGYYLVLVGGWPILAVGLASIIAGLAYTGGPHPLAYTGLGELFVWLFFGLIAVTGSYYLQTATISDIAMLAGAMIGMPAAAVLVVNNYRDLEQDRHAGKKTLAVRFGRRASCYEYTLLMLIPFALLPLIQPLRAGWWLLPWLTLPWALLLIKRFWTQAPGPGFNVLLAATARFQFVLGVLLCLNLLAAPGFATSH